MPSSSPILPEHVVEWASLFFPNDGGGGRNVRSASRPRPPKKPTTPAEIAEAKERKRRSTELKKIIKASSGSKSNTDGSPDGEGDDAKKTGNGGTEEWSEGKIGRELNRLASSLVMDPTEDLPAYRLDDSHPDNTVDHRAEGGPLMNYLWSDASERAQKGHDYSLPLQGQTLYLGGEVGNDGRIYCIPGHASRVLVIDNDARQSYRIGPQLTSNGKLYKWLRGIVVGDIIYGLPCHADEILRIDVKTSRITKIHIPYEDICDTPEEARRERTCEWKYHGGSVCPADGCIYAVPQRAERVLKFDPATEKASLVGPKFVGRCKWYGGVLGKADGAIYCIPQNARGVLRISPPDKVTVHGDFGEGDHKWHGAAAARDGTIACVPANSEEVLCVTPRSPGDPEYPEPILTLVGSSEVVQSGRHRSDGRYKYLGAECGPNGKVYIFPCASEQVLQVDTVKMTCKNIGPNLRDAGYEKVFQNKWQNGLCCDRDGCVYGIPLSGHTLLRIDTKTEDEERGEDPEVTTWALPSPRIECRDKFEGGVILKKEGVMFTVPNNHKGVLRIEPAAILAATKSEA